MTERRIRSILAASDLGPASDEIVRAAGALADHLGARLHLLNSLEVEQLPAMESPSYPERIGQAERLLKEQAQRLAPRCCESTVVLDYAPDRAIEARAVEVGADLVVLGPHRGGQVGAHLLGTTAERVIRTAKVPTLVVRGPLAVPVRLVGVPTDFSEPAAGALDVALALAGALGGGGTEIRLFHVGWSIERGEGLVERKLGPALERQAEEAAARAGGETPTIRTEVIWGVSPAECIADHARDEGMDLLVIGSRGEGGLRRLLIGSVASGVASKAPCPVLLVPPA